MLPLLACVQNDFVDQAPRLLPDFPAPTAVTARPDHPPVAAIVTLDAVGITGAEVAVNGVVLDDLTAPARASWTGPATTWTTTATAWLTTAYPTPTTTACSTASTPRSATAPTNDGDGAIDAAC